MPNESLTGWKIVGMIATLAIIAAFPLYIFVEHHGLVSSPVAAPNAPAVFVGSQSCRECHKTEYDKWKGSHHERAMDAATEQTVLGDFDNTVFAHLGVVSRFFRKSGRFYVHTAGPEGTMGDFEVTHTFGWYPLQQYLVPFPGGRLQCLPLAWDVRNKKWYHLYPDEPLAPKDWLYWTNAGQNWNGMCAECHSTNLQKNYDIEKDAYRTTWSEISVGCEACHGPGSRHVAWADMPAMARPQDVINFELAVRTGDVETADQVRLCASCHSRRAILGDYTHHEDDLLDTLLPTLLTEGLYYPDGQILDEVYVYGSFTQSKMYHRGVRCGDCHDVHSIKPLNQGNDLCLQCHRAAVYDTPAHHFHKGEGEAGEPIKDKNGHILFEVGSGSQCVQCHMPGRTYMGIDYRPDHSLRIPRPDMSVELETPNACNRCHLDKTTRWADEAVTKWYGPGRSKHYGIVIAAGRRHRGVFQYAPTAAPAEQAGTEKLHRTTTLQYAPTAAELVQLAGDILYPVVVRATALDLLGQYPGEEAQGAIERAAIDPEALIRRTAANRSALLPPENRRKMLAGLLYDPVAAVRMEAAYQITYIADLQLPEEQERVFQTALSEYEKAMAYSSDFAFGRYNLGNLYENLKHTRAAMDHYRAAIEIDDRFYMAKVNLAVLCSRTGNNAEAEKLLREALAVRDDLYEVHYFLGLLLAEEEKYKEAAGHLETAARGMPDFARVHYNLGQLLDFLQETEKAKSALERAYRLEPQNTDYRNAMARHYLRRQKTEDARRVLEKQSPPPKGQP